MVSKSICSMSQAKATLKVPRHGAQSRKDSLPPSGMALPGQAAV